MKRINEFLNVDYQSISKNTHHKETMRDKKPGCGFQIAHDPRKVKPFSLSYHDSHMGHYSSARACQAVIDIHYRDLAKRKLKDEQLKHDPYYDDLQGEA